MKNILLLFFISLAGFATAQEPDSLKSAGALKQASDNFGTYTPGLGFKVVKTTKGDLNIKIFSYVRYLNQLGLNDSTTNAFGKTTGLDKRQDVQLNKVNIQFLGWLLDPRFRYIFYSEQGLAHCLV